MDDVLVVHVLDTFTDLAHEDDASFLSQNEVIQDDSVEQFSTLNAVCQRNSYR